MGCQAKEENEQHFLEVQLEPKLSPWEIWVYVTLAHRFLAWTLTGIARGHLSLPASSLSHCYNILSLFFLFQQLEGGKQEYWCGGWRCNRLTQVQKWQAGACRQLSSSLSQMDGPTCLDNCSSRFSGRCLSIWCFVFGSPTHVTSIRVRKC